MYSNRSKTLVLSFMTVNVCLAVFETVTQLSHYSLATFATPGLKETELAFILGRAVLHAFLFLVYALFHSEPQLTCCRKVICFGIHMSCVYIGYTPGVHMSFFSKYYLESENGMVIAKVVNVYIFVFTTLPKLLVVSVNASGTGNWTALDVICIVSSFLYVVWCVVFYLTCSIKEVDFELEMDELARIWDEAYRDTNENPENANENHDGNDRHEGIQREGNIEMENIHENQRNQV